MTDWHEDSAARSRRLRGEKTVEQRLEELERRLDALEDGETATQLSNMTLRAMLDCITEENRHCEFPDHDPLGR